MLLGLKAALICCLVTGIYKSPFLGTGAVPLLCCCADGQAKSLTRVGLKARPYGGVSSRIISAVSEKGNRLDVVGLALFGEGAVASVGAAGCLEHRLRVVLVPEVGEEQAFRVGTR